LSVVIFTDAIVADPTVTVEVVETVAEEAALPNVITEVPAAAPVIVNVATPAVVVAEAVTAATVVVADVA
jgi:hypothetical protein